MHNLVTFKTLEQPREAVFRSTVDDAIKISDTDVGLTFQTCSL